MIKISRLTLLTASLLVISNTAYSLPDPTTIKKRCDIQDPLTSFEAFGRSDWALRCNYLSRRTHDYYVHDDYGNRRIRPKYPSFANRSNFSDWMAAPRTKMASCEAFGYLPVITCIVNSNTPLETNLLFAPGELSVYDAYTQQVQQLIVIDEHSTLDSLHYKEESVTINAVKADVQQLEIVTIHTQRGKTLTVTQDHPLLIAQGILKNARNLSKKDTLIDQDGELDKIISVKTSMITAQLYNTQINTRDPKKESVNQLVVTQGFLSGYLADNGEQEIIHRLTLRDNLPFSLTY
ncbi:hypothetical protein PCIT_b0299 [Pseudoalteromonas citrea]|uniref:Cell surface protein n=2 Tax=Pseudoalteromonas citrea TaxID=43655 RepID=A0AAD4FPT3_9GAMM|nr:hypothetical protein [Pseudoalteromonas citrea]KAF7764327.1 hypothetical protein PCIT_b0299 [Pseudoalteromonas citrea]